MRHVWAGKGVGAIHSDAHSLRAHLGDKHGHMQLRRLAFCLRSVGYLLWGTCCTSWRDTASVMACTDLIAVLLCVACCCCCCCCCSSDRYGVLDAEVRQVAYQVARRHAGRFRKDTSKNEFSGVNVDTYASIPVCSHCEHVV